MKKYDHDALLESFLYGEDPPLSTTLTQSDLVDAMRLLQTNSTPMNYQSESRRDWPKVDMTSVRDGDTERFMFRWEYDTPILKSPQRVIVGDISV